MLKRLTPNLIFTLISFGIIVVLGSSYFSKLPKEVTPKKYTNAEYSYTFSYPGDLAVLEYSPAYVAVGTTTKDTFEVSAHIDLISSEPGEKGSFSDFVHRSSMNMCAADGPNGSIHCDQVIKSSPAKTKGGLTGELFSLLQIEETFPSHATSTRERGPFFAFDVSKNVPGKKYTALIIHPPIAGTDDIQHINVIESIVDSLVVAKTNPVGNPPDASGTTTPQKQNLTAKIAQTVSGSGVSITPIKILEDSRCPTDVRCIQAGTVRLQILLTSGLGNATSTISFEQGITTEAEVLTLQDVLPKKNSKVTPSLSEYSFVFTVSKR